jgi:hypothetical protein
LGLGSWLPRQLGELAADEVQPLLDLDEAVVQLVESLVGLTEEPVYIIKTLIDPLETTVMHIEPGAYAGESLVMLATECDEDVDAVARLGGVSALLLDLRLRIRHDRRLLRR